MAKISNPRVKEAQQEIDVLQEQYRNGMMTQQEKLVAMLAVFHDKVYNYYQGRIAEYLTESTDNDDVTVAQFILQQENHLVRARKQLNLYVKPEFAVDAEVKVAGE